MLKKVIFTIVLSSVVVFLVSFKSYAALEPVINCLIPSDFVVHSFRPPMEEAMSRLWSQLG